MYANDVTLFNATSTLPELNENLQHELNTVVDWVTPLNLHIENNVVEQVNRFTLLGVRLDHLLSWSDQIDHCQ